MSSPEPEPLYSSFKLQHVLAKARKRGATSVAGAAAELPLPNMKVEGVGELTFPLLPDQAEKLAEAAQQAPFGRGLETVVDTSVRNTLQIGPDNVDIESTPGWRDGFDQLVDRAVDSLGTDPAFVEARLYKLLLYQKGGHFDFHRDTEKERGMFATLVVQLPSDFSGGEFVVRHGGVEKTYTLGSDDSSCSQMSHFVAHYADCEHAVREVTGGHRLALVYSLCWKGEGAPPTSTGLSSTALSKRLASILEEGYFENDVPIPLCVHLEHQYTEASLGHLGIRALKGRDRATADAFSAASSVLAKKGKELSMCVASCSQVRVANCDIEGESMDDDWSFDQIDEMMSTELKVVFEPDGKVNRAMEDLRVNWSNWVVNDSLIPSDSDGDCEKRRERRDAKDDRSNGDVDDDYPNFEEYDSDDHLEMRFQRLGAWRSTHETSVHVTGNAGATRNTTYACYILLVFPRKDYVDILLKCHMKHALSYVDSISGAEKEVVLSYIVRYLSFHLTDALASSCALLLQALVKYSKTQLVCDLLEVLATTPLRCNDVRTVCMYSIGRCEEGVALCRKNLAEAICDTVDALGRAHLQPAIEKLLVASHKHGSSQLNERLILIQRLDLDMEQKLAALEDLLHVREEGRYVHARSVPKAGMRLLLSLNDADWLARFEEHSRRMREERLVRLIQKIDTVLAEEEHAEPGRSVFERVRKEAAQARVREFVKGAEKSERVAMMPFWEEPEYHKPFWEWHVLEPGEEVEPASLAILLRDADAASLLRFKAAVLKWKPKRLAKLVRQMSTCTEKSGASPDALLMMVRIRAALIEDLQEKTRVRPEYSHEMSNARCRNPNLQKFLRGPFKRTKISVDRTIHYAHYLAKSILAKSGIKKGYTITAEATDPDDPVIIITKTPELYENALQTYEKNSSLLEELTKEQEKAMATLKSSNNTTTSHTSSSTGVSEPPEPVSQQAIQSG